MDKKTLFSETLTSLVEFAATQSNKITFNDIKLYFKDLIDDDSQYKFIYDYLAINKISVDEFDLDTTTQNIFLGDTASGITSDESGFSLSDSTVVSSMPAESEEELAFIQMYMDEMNLLPSVNDAEKKHLVEKLISGDVSVVTTLVESCLSMVADTAQNYRGKGVTFGDLIQEGNIELMTAISEYTSDFGDFDAFMQSRVIAALKDTINSQINSDRIGQHLADKLNHLDSVTQKLNKKLGRVPTIPELAEAMSISEEEASILLKTSLDTLSVNEDTDTGNNDVVAKTSDSDLASNNDPLEWRVNKK